MGRTKQDVHTMKGLRLVAILLFGILVLAALTLAVLQTRGPVSQKTLQLASTANPVYAGAVQEVHMSVQGSRYEPSTITLEQGRPVRFVVDGTNADGCARGFMIPSLGVRQNLQPGENVFEFTPTQEGEIPFSCTMGMVRGKFVVVGPDGTAPVQTAAQDAAQNVASTGCHMGSGGGGCGCGG
jgi:uncharacterized protein